MTKISIAASLRESVILRAYKCCEYCKSQDKYSLTFFTIDHTLPESLDGATDFENLAYACFLCNRLKSNKLNVFDRTSDKWIPLFNPRKDIWSKHFAWNDDATRIIGITITGSITVNQLKLNREKLIEYRHSLILFGEHPPEYSIA